MGLRVCSTSLFPREQIEPALQLGGPTYALAQHRRRVGDLAEVFGGQGEELGVGLKMRTGCNIELILNIITSRDDTIRTDACGV